MNTFLHTVASDLYEKLQGDFSKLTLVFPNKRARLFFIQALESVSTKPTWEPQFTTISEIFEQNSRFVLADPISLICRLYQSYIRITGREETLDNFYSWGEIMLQDFDDVDNNLVPAEILFSNLEDLDALTRTDYLSENQRKAIEEFFHHFDIQTKTELKEKFLSIWNKLHDIYLDFRKELENAGEAYAGMIKRDIIERHSDDIANDCSGRIYAVVGFNVLNKTEERLFKLLQEKAENVYFYWDYDTFYLSMENGEAGRFIRHNRQLFGSALPDTHECFRGMQNPNKEITFVSAATEHAQASYVGRWIEKNVDPTEQLNETGVVLCNEKLLQSMLHAIPSNYQLNITMGFPIQQTPVSSFLIALLELQMHGFTKHSIAYINPAAASDHPAGASPVHSILRRNYLNTLLRHPYMHQLCPDSAAKLYSIILQRNMLYVDMTLLTQTEPILAQDEMLQSILSPQPDNAALLRYLHQILQAIGRTYQGTGSDEDAESRGKGAESHRKDAESHDKDAESGNKSNQEAAQKPDADTQFYSEAVFNAYTLLNRLISLHDSQMLEVQPQTLYKLIKQLLAGKSVPFHGEPAIGLQVMGILETRNLDFRNLLLLSTSDDNLPKSDRKSSFIPYNLREAYGMTTIEKRNSLYAYYFYRLIQRAERVVLLYNNSTDGLSKGEMSRFMRQLLIDLPPEQSQAIRMLTLQAENDPMSAHVLQAEKTPEVLARLYERYDWGDEGSEDAAKTVPIDVEKTSPTAIDGTERADEKPDGGVAKQTPRKKSFLSPSSINTFISCPFKFYLNYVAGVKPTEVLDEEVDSSIFGNIFHYCMEQIYSVIFPLEQELQAVDLNRLAADRTRIENLVDEGFNIHFFRKTGDAVLQRPVYNGEQQLNREVLITYVINQLGYDAQLAPLTIHAVEDGSHSKVVAIETDARTVHVKFGGIIDRIDTVTTPEGKLHRIVDYKTSSNQHKASKISTVFDPNGDNRPYHILQTLYYASIYSEQTGKSVAPALMYVKLTKEGNKQSSVCVKIGNESLTDFTASPHAGAFNSMLQAHVWEIFSPGTPFEQTLNAHTCRYCDYVDICGKMVKEDDFT